MNLHLKVCAFFVLPLSLFCCDLARAGENDLVWSTFLGGSDYDLGYGVAMDGHGDVYVTGVVTSEDFPKKAGFVDTTHGGRDVLVAKLYATGDSLIYATLLGGSEDDEGKAIVVDGDGNVYVTGVTNSEDFPTTPGALSTSYIGSRDVILAKLDPTGSILEYSTFLGGSGSDWGNGLAVDEVGNAYVIGYTNSEDFPVTAGAYDTTYNGGHWDAFVAKLDPVGSDLEYATFLGGYDWEDGQGITLDESGDAYVMGNTCSPDFPVTTGSFDTTHNGNYDVFISKIAERGAAVVYSSLLGGSEADYGYGIAVDGSGDVYVTGKTVSSDFPITGGAYDATHGGYSSDVFVTKFNSAGSALEYSTFLGGSGADEGHGLALDSSGRAYISGWTYSLDFPTTPGAFGPTHSGYYSDAFVVKLNPSGSGLEYGTFLGGNRDDLSWAIAVSDHGYVYVTGETKSPDFPTTPGAFSTTLTGDYADVFVLKLDLVGTPVAPEAPAAELPKTCALHQNHPNPFNNSTEIRYLIPEDAHVTLRVYNVLGAEVATLVDASQKAGAYSARWDARDLASGVYFCRLQAGEFTKTVKMVLLK